MDIDTRIAEAEEATGKRLIVRAITTPEPQFRAWVDVRADSVIIEYAEEQPGYFWGYELLERLLEWVEDGGASAWFYEQGDRLIRIPASRHTPENTEESGHSP